MSLLYRLLATRNTDDPIPAPTEAEAAAGVAPKQKFDLGCMYAQVIIDTFLLGVFFMQTVTYFTNQRGDAWWLKSIVVSTCFMTLAMSCFIWCMSSSPALAVG